MTPLDRTTAPSRPMGLWLAAVFCAFIATSPILFYSIASSMALMSPSESQVLSPWSRYFSLQGLLYFGSAALAGGLLVVRNRWAQWPAMLVVLFLGLVQLMSNSTRVEPVAWSLVRLTTMAAFAAVAWYSYRLAKRGVLQ